MKLRPPPPSSAIDTLDDQAAAVAHRLEDADLRIVLAESCTAGTVAAVLGGVPGISRYLCGSSVVYQEETKIAWLDIQPEQLRTWGTVGEEVTDCLARNVLTRTPHADLAVAVTGHLGPDAPPEQDGIVHVDIRFRHGDHEPAVCRLADGGRAGPTARRSRQRLATAFVLERIHDACAP